MLRAASGGNPNEIIFRMMLEADPRARQNMQAFKKDALQIQSDIIKGEQSVDDRKTQIIERGEQKRATVRKSNLDRMVAEEERALNRLDATLARLEASRRNATRERVIGNVLGSAGVRNAADEARANFYRRQQEAARQREINDGKMTLVWQEAANRNAAERIQNEQRLQRELERTADLQRRSSAAVVSGFMRSAEGASTLLHGLAALSVVGGESLQGVAQNLLLVAGGVSTAKGVFNLGRGAAGAATAAGGGSFLAGAGAIGGAALRFGGPLAGAAALMYADNAGYQRMLAEQDARAGGYLKSWGSSFDPRMTAMNRRLGQNDFLFGLGMRDSQFAGGIARNSAANARSAGDAAFFQFERASQGFGGMGGQDIRLSPQAQAQHMQRFAGDIEAAQRAEMEGLRQNLQIRMREREVVSEISRISIDGMSRVSGLLREQLATERERQQARLDENRSLAARIGAMDAKDFNRLNRTAGNLAGATPEQLREAMGFGGGLGDAATAEAERRGNAALGQDNNIAKFLGPRTLDLGKMVATQMAAALADKSEENARVIADAVKKVMNKIVQDAATAIVDGEDRQAKIQDVVKQKLEQRNAVMQQAEK